MLPGLRAYMNIRHPSRKVLLPDLIAKRRNSTMQRPPGLSISYHTTLHQLRIHPIRYKRRVLVHHGPHGRDYARIPSHQHPRRKMDRFVRQLFVARGSLAGGQKCESLVLERSPVDGNEV
ncbi:hypothetical protein AG1IA_05107 [Rhizoctonia solani AG-1 IA]|uniref:Uncharacterized protein n=1 Tax=Thanatephorus cucumeris (strain AG1-IA) TaxID=983506 RepID=L8WWY4_THACA|nr:hypothetical protein AG1IA_05107 [Rhizoctonia solani AG-1 IA]